jgi:hypothetical protein
VEGFKIGGITAGVAHGAVHGHGIYTGPTADISAGYNRSSRRLLLLKVLLGSRSSQQLTPADCGPAAVSDRPFQSYTVANFAHILASPDLVLPLYAIEWA